MMDLDARIAETVHRAITRRTFLQRAMRWGLVAGVALSSPFTLFQGRAAAGSCSPGGVISTYGCLCADTQGCAGCNTNGCAGSLRERCNAWETPDVNGQYCWCSLVCCNGGNRGFYSCCDCWSGGTDDGHCLHAHGGTACVCKHFHFMENC